jgi:hypothetical protein
MDEKYYMTSKKFLELASNLLNEKGENNQKLLNILLTGMNLNIKLYEDMLKLNYLNDLEGVMLDLYAKMLGLYRTGLNDQDFRSLIKSTLMLKSNGVSFNSIITALSTFLNIDPKLIRILEPNNDSDIESRHIQLISIYTSVDINKMIAFLKQIKAAGIIIDCYEYIVSEIYYEYDYVEYDDFLSSYTKIQQYKINCRGEISDITDYKNLFYEYDQHEYPLNELIDINEK